MADPAASRDKSALRASVRAARASLSAEERSSASARLVSRLERMPELRRARTVVLYAATSDEIDPAGLLGHLVRRQARVLLPRVAGERLDLVTTSDLSTLRLGYRGIAEPVGIAVDPAVVEVAVLPGVAFDLAGGRLGQGGGHYDRLLARLPDTALRVGACFACQVVPRVPREDHDAPVDVVVTDRVTHRVEARR